MAVEPQIALRSNLYWIKSAQTFFRISALGLVLCVMGLNLAWIGGFSTLLIARILQPPIIPSVTAAYVLIGLGVSCCALFEVGFKRRVGAFPDTSKIVGIIIVGWLPVISDILIYSGLVWIPSGHHVGYIRVYYPGPLYFLWFSLVLIGPILLGMFFISWGRRLISFLNSTEASSFQRIGYQLLVLSGIFICLLVLPELLWLFFTLGYYNSFLQPAGFLIASIMFIPAALICGRSLWSA